MNSVIEVLILLGAFPLGFGIFGTLYIIGSGIINYEKHSPITKGEEG